METAGHLASNLFPSLGPSLMISMGYIDLGKWVAAVEGGARFGYDLVFLVLFFNLTAIFCQYLATCVGMVTQKNLAQICSEEYCRSACIALGVQAALSMITSELTMILGIAYGINLLTSVDLWACICLAAVGAVILPFITLLGKRLNEEIYICIAGFSLLFYVLGVLISQPEIPLVMDVIFPKLSGENSYLLMALLGSSIMAHNFYIQSSIVQRQRRLPNATMGALFHDHFFAIVFIFTSIFLVNYVLINSAAAFFNSTDIVFSFQDVSLLIDQVFRTPIAPIAIFLVLLFSSQITSLTWNIGGRLILQYLFGANLSSWVHYLFVKALSVVPALCCATCAGPEGIYQLLIFCQIIQAMLLPSSVIPLFRVASSRSLMRGFKISWHMEILALFAFFGMLASNVIFLTEMLFGNSSWINNLGGTMGTTATVPYAVILLLACASIVSTLYLAVTPLKSVSDGPENEIWTSHTWKYQHELSEVREDDDQDKIASDEDQMFPAEPTLENSTESHHDKSVIEVNLLQSGTTMDPEDERYQSHNSNDNGPCTSPVYSTVEPIPINDVDLEPVDKLSAGNLSDPSVLKRVDQMEPVQRDLALEGDNHTDKDSEGTLELEESLREPMSATATEDSGSVHCVKGQGFDGGNGSGSLSKLSGLGRAARRQLAGILDEFWGYLFDFHGKLTQEAMVKKFDVLLGMDTKAVNFSMKMDAVTESSKSFFKDTDRATIFPANSIEYNSPKGRNLSRLEFLYGAKMGMTSWSHDMHLSNTPLQSSSGSLLEPVQKTYSSLHLPQYSENRDYQPATIHGYQIASDLKGIGAGRSPYSSYASLDRPTTIKSAAPFVPSLRDSVSYAHRQAGLNSLRTSGLHNPTMSRASGVQVEAPYYDHAFVESAESVDSSSYAKKYHSSPDISALIAASRNALLNEMKWGEPIGPKPFLGRMTSGQSQFNPLSKTGFPLAFDEISPPKLHEDVFSLQSNLNQNAKSLWSRQPFEQLFGVMNREQSRGDESLNDRTRIASRETLSYSELEAKLLQSFQFCIVKLLNLEGSDWLFRQNGGCDEELVNQVALNVKTLRESETHEINQLYSSEIQYLSSVRKPILVQKNEDADSALPLSLPNCGEGCIWHASLVVSFGVWCVRRILELSLVESRPELWGKYTYVLNRLQGILDLAFLKPRRPLATCLCFEEELKDVKTFNCSLPNISYKIGKPIKGSFTTANMILEIIKDVEIAVAGRKGRTGTAAGDIAFPKGKENLASVLKRYKRRLSNKFPGAHEGTSSRKTPANSSVS
ncbi:ethylene-insensitive protein 2 [Musa troglodytarum]|uniref:Ethylene-insensitive protein 2 n=2 Tax=Musa troglodytarum TaxID=320322 RepID=A0A9E7KDD0_9LILI|nr:ethylene-insensitive protein 2 [Musa troglodytarum]URE16193.1 ethylene-insensitive protein 2 [Musa troglodytarum]